MKISYRLNVFESNSSSTYNMAIGTEDDFDAAGPEILNEYLETDCHEFITPKGEKVYVICEYGWED